MVDLSMIPDFIVEAHEHLEGLESNLLKLELAADDPETINEIFRAMHTIKGAAQFVGVERVAELTHKLENLLELIRQGKKEIDLNIIDTLIAGKDRISLLVNEMDNFQMEKTEIDDLLERIKAHEEDSPEIDSIDAEQPEGPSANIEDQSPDEIELTDDFSELFTTFDEEEDDFTEDIEIIAALSDEEYEDEDQPASFLPDQDEEVDAPAAIFDEHDEEDTSLTSSISQPVPDFDDTELDSFDFEIDGPQKESSPDSTNDIDIEPLKDEIADEDVEDEIFQIFIEQLQENISLLRAQVEILKSSPDNSAVIAECSNLLSRLQSSANYMSYNWLAKFYSQWIAEVEMMDLQLSADGNVTFDFMDNRIGVIAEIFPQIAKSLEETSLPDDTVAETEPLQATRQNEGPEGIDEDEDLDEFSDLFKIVDDTEDTDFTDDSQIIAALSEEENPSPPAPDTKDTSEGIDVLFTDPFEVEEIEEPETLPVAEPSDKNEASPSETVTAPTPKALDPAILQKDIENEDFDDDLVLIFIEQLQENITLLNQLTADFVHSHNKSNIVGQCADLLSKLHSSANYMGYDRLTDFYGQWIAELEMIDLELSTGSKVNYDFMNDNIKVVCTVFPQIEVQEIEQPEVEPQPDITEVEFYEIDETPSPEDVQAEEETSPPEEMPESDEDTGVEPVEEEFEAVMAAFADDEEKTDQDDDIQLPEEFDHITETFEHDTEEMEVEDREISIFDETDPFAEDVVEEETELEIKAEKIPDEVDDLIEDMFEVESEETIEADDEDIEFLFDDEQEQFEDQEEEFEDDSDLSQVDDSVTESDVRRTELFEKLSGELDALDSELEDEGMEEVEPKSLLTLLQNEIDSDITDQDLVDIYINQLRDSISTLQNLIADFDQSDEQQKIMDECTIIVDGLRSSSSYMDYEHFEGFYRKWLKQISSSQEELSGDMPAEIPYMLENIDIVKQVFPQLSDVPDETAELEGTGETETEKEESPEEVLAPSTPTLPDDEQQLFDKLSSALEAEADKQLEDEPSGTLTGDDDQLLYDKLSRALETRELDHTPATLKPIDDVINEILTGTGFAVPSRQEIPVQKPTEELSPPFERRRDLFDRRQEITDRRRGLVDRREGETGSPAKVNQSIRVDADKIDFLMNQVGELVVNRSYISQLYKEMNEVQKYYQGKGLLNKDELKPLKDHVNKLNEASISLGRVSSEMQDSVIDVRMMPVSDLFKRYPRLVRDLTHDTNKQVQLEIVGEETQLDKTVIDEISDPLLHLIRNAIDHGIETVEERRNAGKEETATVRLEAYPDSSNIVIEVTDDGRGIDPHRIKEKALEKNFFSSEELEAMTDEELTYLIMTPGLSTADKPTRTSGRGVGMDIVRTNIDKLNGSIEIKSLAGHETMIRLRIPLTLAIIQTLGVIIGTRVLTIPLTSVEETARISLDDIEDTDGLKTCMHRDLSLPLIELGEILNIPTEDSDHKHAYIVIVKSDGQRAGLVVDKFLGMDESVIKPLADYLRQESGFSGATVKGDGTISLIIDIPTLLDIISERQPTPQQKEALDRLMKGPVHA